MMQAEAREKSNKSLIEEKTDHRNKCLFKSVFSFKINHLLSATWRLVLS